MEKRAVFTIVANNYIGQALTLCESIVSDEQVDIFVFLVDGIRSNEKLKRIKYTFVDVFDLAIPEFEEMSFKYDVIELSTAVKPYVFDYIFDKYNYCKILYLDPDLYFYNKIDCLFEMLEGKTAILTPHILDYSDTNNRHFERVVIKNGVYNLGFLGLTLCDESKKLVKWWERHLVDRCFRGDGDFFTDQKWAEFFPVLFDNVHICKDKSLNVAVWNITERNVLYENDVFYVTEKNGEDINKKPLIFAHISQIDIYQIDKYIEQYQHKITELEYESIKILYQKYAFRLKENNYEEYKKEEYKYDYFINGDKILKIHRRIYASMLERGVKYDKPFDVDKKSFYNILKKNGLIEKKNKSKSGKKEPGEIKNKSKILRVSNCCMKCIVRVIGIRRYMLVLKYMKSNKIDNQDFLIGKVKKCKGLT